MPSSYFPSSHQLTQSIHTTHSGLWPSRETQFVIRMMIIYWGNDENMSGFGKYFKSVVELGGDEWSGVYDRMMIY